MAVDMSRYVYILHSGVVVQLVSDGIMNIKKIIVILYLISLTFLSLYLTVQAFFSELHDIKSEFIASSLAQTQGCEMKMSNCEKNS